MGRKYHEIGRLCLTDTEAAADKMREVFVRSGASCYEAAYRLGCTRWTFKRWMKELGLVEEFRGVRDILSTMKPDDCSGPESPP